MNYSRPQVTLMVAMVRGRRTSFVRPSLPATPESNAVHAAIDPRELIMQLMADEAWIAVGTVDHRDVCGAGGQRDLKVDGFIPRLGDDQVRGVALREKGSVQRLVPFSGIIGHRKKVVVGVGR